jgi:hypothetical protein
MVFGGVPSVSNFDRLGKTIVDFTIAKTRVAPKYVFRTLDDIPIVSPENSGITEKFTDGLFEICRMLNVPLAEECPLNEKAFKNQTRGTVLGIGFDTTNSTWFLADKKANKVEKTCLGVISAQKMKLKQVQKVMGLVNDLSQLCPFMRPFRYCGNKFLAEFEGREDILLDIPYRMKLDMYVCANIADRAKYGIPIARRKSQPGLKAMRFYSDADGACFTFVKGEKVVAYVPEDRGVASIALDDEDQVWWWSALRWTKKFLSEMEDEKGAKYGSKTTTLEAVGLLLPLLSVPEKLKGREVAFYTDNLAVVYGWENGGVKFDETATTILRAVHVIACYLGMTVHVKHVQRMSNTHAVLVDHLSREATVTKLDEKLLQGVRMSACDTVLYEWMDNPRISFGLPRKLLNIVKGKLQN